LNKYIIKSFFLFAIILAILTSANLYALSVEKNEKSERENQIKDEITNKKQLQDLEAIRREKIRNFIREKILRRNEKNRLDSLELTSAAEKNDYEFNLDISNNFKYKRLQERSLSCELSAASDIVSYFINKKVTEIYIIKQVSKDYYNKPFEVINNKKIWGNPNAWYVWYIDKLSSWQKARQYNMTWYWVLEKPIANIFKDFGLETKIITNKDYNENYNKYDHLTEILQSINNWNMVQLWWDYCTNPLYEDTANKNKCINFSRDRTIEWYYNEDWKLIKHEWLIWEHAFYLLWYKWWVENPSDIIVWDTQTGKHTFPIKEWLRKWDLMQNRSIIISNNT
jgi:hypothetical protein